MRRHRRRGGTQEDVSGTGPCAGRCEGACAMLQRCVTHQLAKEVYGAGSRKVTQNAWRRQPPGTWQAQILVDDESVALSSIRSLRSLFVLCLILSTYKFIGEESLYFTNLGMAPPAPPTAHVHTGSGECRPALLAPFLRFRSMGVSRPISRLTGVLSRVSEAWPSSEV